MKELLKKWLKIILKISRILWNIFSVMSSSFCIFLIWLTCHVPSGEKLTDKIDFNTSEIIKIECSYLYSQNMEEYEVVSKNDIQKFEKWLYNIEITDRTFEQYGKEFNFSRNKSYSIVVHYEDGNLMDINYQITGVRTVRINSETYEIPTSTFQQMTNW